MKLTRFAIKTNRGFFGGKEDFKAPPEKIKLYGDLRTMDRELNMLQARRPWLEARMVEFDLSVAA